MGRSTTSAPVRSYDATRRRRVRAGSRSHARNVRETPHARLVATDSSRRATRTSAARSAQSGAERHAIEEPQRADDLVQCRPRDPRCNQMKLKGVDIFQAETIRRAAKIPAQLRYRAEVRLLRRRRQIADRHVLDHAAAKS